MAEPISILEGLFRMYVHEANDSQVSRVLGETHQWEGYSTKLVREDLKPGMTFVDAGANIGYYTLLASKLVGPEGRVFAFEPYRLNFDVLMRNVFLNSAFTSNVVALMAPLWSDPNVDMAVVPTGDNQGDVSVRLVLDPAAEIASTQRVVSHTLDGIFAHDTVDFLKIDAQSADAAILAGGRRLFAESARKDIRLLIETPGDTPEKLGFEKVTDTMDYNHYYVKKGGKSP